MIELDLRAFVMHHPSRSEERVAEIVAALQPLKPEVVTDTFSHGPWWTASECWRAGARSGGTHVLVVHDDALLCAGFAESALEAMRARPCDVVSFHCQRAEILEASKQGCAWVGFDTFAWGLANCMSVVDAAAFAEWGAQRINPDKRHDDLRLLLWLLETGDRRYWCTVPSLAQHNPSMVSVTNAGHPNMGDTSPLYAEHGLDNAKAHFSNPGLSSFIVGRDRAQFLISRRHHFSDYAEGSSAEVPR